MTLRLNFPQNFQCRDSDMVWLYSWRDSVQAVDSDPSVSLYLELVLDERLRSELNSWVTIGLEELGHVSSLQMLILRQSCFLLFPFDFRSWNLLLHLSHFAWTYPVSFAETEEWEVNENSTLLYAIVKTACLSIIVNILMFTILSLIHALQLNCK